MQPLEPFKEAIAELCRTHFVTDLHVFGSVLRPSFNADSDIDLAVRFDGVPPMEYFNNYMDLKEKLELLLGRQVDLIEDKAVKNPIFRAILDREMQSLYERKAA
jgi:predicted nucleotidyltransferase